MSRNPTRKANGLGHYNTTTTTLPHKGTLDTLAGATTLACKGTTHSL